MNENNRSNELLKYYQSLPLEVKVRMTKNRIREFLDREDAYVSFSGGKDSTVLAHLVHQVDKNVPLVFSNTGLEYADIQSFARRNDAVFVRPQMRFDEVITKYGYPIISKEVSECIYYARKINNSRTKCARTTVRKQNELNGTRKITDGKRQNE